MELFKEDGHLTDLALKMSVENTLGETESLEVSEHLSFCDECLVRYSNFLTDDVLIEPEKPLTQSIMRKIRQKVIKIIFNRYFAATAAAVFAIVFWQIGVFSDIYEVSKERNLAKYKPDTHTTVIDDINNHFNKLNENWNKILSKFDFNYFNN